MLGRALVGALCVLAVCPAGAAAAPRALVVFLPGPAPANGHPASPDPLLRVLERRPLATGLMGPTQGTYTPQQALLDLTQGIRLSPPGYSPQLPGRLRLAVVGRGGVIEGWRAVVARAVSAPSDIVPGRLASAVPGGAGFAAVAGGPTLDAVAAADRRGRVAAVSLGPASSIAARARGLLHSHRLVVVELAMPPAAAERSLDSLLAARRPGELVVAIQSPPHIHSLQPLPIGVATGGAAGRGLASETTRTDGVVAGIDLLPTILRHLRLPVAGTVTGQPIRVQARRAAPALERLRVRYSHVAPRRVLTLEAMVAAWALLTLALAAAAGEAGARRGLRLGALAFLWAPAVVLVPSAIDPAAAAVETAIVTAGAFGLAALTDLVLPWPRGPIAPAAVCLAAYTFDLAAGTNLVELSLLGPNPRSGARFFGIGNELEPALPILLFVGLAAVFGSRPRSRRMALTFAALGTALAAVVGSGYLGADVGGVITVSAGAAVATLAVLPGGVTRRGVAVAVCVPAAAVGLLALLDLATGASSHFARNVLEGQGGASIWEVIGRRYHLAYRALFRGLMPLTASASVAATVAAIALRRRLYAGLPGPAWRAALLGGLAAGVVGALTNDSGPLLFVVAVIVLGLVTAYLQGATAASGTPDARPGADAGRAAPGGPAPSPVQQSPAATDRPEGGRPPATVP
ncbi:MAG: hypothetical protein ACJ76S_01665 [Solirubrobacteraceae bacterium]